LRHPPRHLSRAKKATAGRHGFIDVSPFLLQTATTPSDKPTGNYAITKG